MKGRTKLGRFAQGNTIAKSGWKGLVEKRFGGNTAIAKAYVAQLGRHTYAKQTVAGTRFEYRLQTTWPHPGTPEEFSTRYEAMLDAIKVKSAQPLEF